MRKLTIKRGKTFVGCAMKIKFYIRDEAACELMIEGTPCRKLGELKNGEEKTFSVGDGEQMIFAIVDNLSKGYCNDVRTIPAGTEDVVLTGKNRFVLGTNPFIFDGEASEEMQRKRKQNGRKGLLIFIACVIAGTLIGMFIGGGIGSIGTWDKAPQPKTFSVENMQITLTDQFSAYPNDQFSAIYGYADIAVMIMKEAFTDYEGLENCSVDDYGNAAIEINGLTSTLSHTDGLSYFEYDAAGEDGQMYHYVYVIYKADDAFWVVQFGSLGENAQQYRAQFIQWAKSVQFT